MARPGALAPLALALAAAGCGGAENGAFTAAPVTAPARPVARVAPAPKPVDLTIEVNGDLLVHSPVWLRARSLAGGRGYAFAPMLRAVRPWIRGADLALCHVETPMSDAPPRGYPVFNTPTALARAIRRTGWDACDTASNHTLDGGQRGVDATIRALDRERVGHTGSAARRRGARRILILRARGVRVAYLAYTTITNGIAPPHAWSVNLASPRRILRDARRARRAGAQVVVVNLHWGTEYRAAPDADTARARAPAGALARDHGDRRPARPRRAADPPRARAVGRLRRGQPALQPDRGVLRHGEPGRHPRAPARARRAGA